MAYIPILSFAQNKDGQEALEDGLLDPFIRYVSVVPVFEPLVRCVEIESPVVI